MTTAVAVATGGGDITFPGFWLAFMFGIITGMVVMAWMRKLSGESRQALRDERRIIPIWGPGPLSCWRRWQSRC